MNTEPVAILALVRATIVLLTSFGAAITDNQAAAIVGFIAALYVVVEAVTTYLARQRVTPVQG